MPERQQPAEDFSGSVRSPGGFVFGVQGWTWGEPRATSITFYLDNTALVADQHGRPIKGAVGPDNVAVKFASGPPQADKDNTIIPRPEFATHQQVVAALEAERINWLKLPMAGWPQLPYDELIKLKDLPPTPVEELRKIRNSSLRKDALRARREADEARLKEGREEEGEEETTETE